jgi:hypothetical protein
LMPDFKALRMVHNATRSHASWVNCNAVILIQHIVAGIPYYCIIAFVALSHLQKLMRMAIWFSQMSFLKQQLWDGS